MYLYLLVICHLNEKQNKQRRPAGSNSGDYQSAVARSDRSSFHVRLDVCKCLGLRSNWEFVEAVTTNLQSLHRIVRLSTCV